MVRARQRYAHTGTRRLIHLPECHCRLGKCAGFLHIVNQVVSFTATLAYARKNRISAVVNGDIVDQLHDERRFTHAGATKQTNFPPLA